MSEDESNVTPIKPAEETPAERAAKIAAVDVPLRDLEGALPRIAAELARHNALQAESIKLQQLQLGLIQRYFDVMSGQLNQSGQFQMKTLEQFGEWFVPILQMATQRPTRTPELADEPAKVPPVEKTGPGFRVEGDPATARDVPRDFEGNRA